MTAAPTPPGDELDLDELERIEAAASSGPWAVKVCNGLPIACFDGDFDDLPRTIENETLKVAARNALPALLARIKAQDAETERSEP